MNDAASPKGRLLIVDDEEIVRASLSGWFEEDGYEVAACSSAREALRAMQEGRFDACLTDIKMPGMDGIELQRKLAEIAPDTAVIVMTAYASVDTAVAALKAGAFDYITKPFDPEDLARLVAKAVDFKKLARENRRLKEQIDENAPLERIVGVEREHRQRRTAGVVQCTAHVHAPACGLRADSGELVALPHRKLVRQRGGPIQAGVRREGDDHGHKVA